jgi:hypothetical protein
MNLAPALSFLLVLAGIVGGRNPLILPSVGLADPHVRVINDQIYMFATHDFSVNNTDFLMRNWWVWTSDNLVRCPLTHSVTQPPPPTVAAHAPRPQPQPRPVSVDRAVTIFACGLEAGRHP